MSSFTKLVVEVIDGEIFSVSQDFSFYREKDKDEIYIVPAGFKSNFASVPRILQLLFSKRDVYSAASVLHDYLYTSKEISREKADLILKEGMLVLGSSKTSAYLFWLAVRLFGRSAWNNAKFD
jgi:hypothetical protein